MIVLSKTGQLIETIKITGPEISGLAVSNEHLYITEQSNGSIFRYDLKDY